MSATFDSPCILQGGKQLTVMIFERYFKVFKLEFSMTSVSFIENNLTSRNKIRIKEIKKTNRGKNIGKR